MAVKELSGLIGRTGVIMLEGVFGVDVRVLDVKEQWGHVRLLVKPMHGAAAGCGGQAWVEEYRVKLVKEGQRDTL